MNYLDNLDPANIPNVIRQLAQKIEALEKRTLNVDSLDQITPNLGDIRTGRLLALISGVEPTDADACGAVISAEGEEFLGMLWHIFGVNNGALMAGISAEDGKLYFCGGKGIIDLSGVNLQGLLYGIRQYAEDPTDATVKRYGRLEMFLPGGKTIPAFGLNFLDGASTAEKVVNGDFELGDLTNWTQVGTSFTVEAAAARAGSYGLRCAGISSGTKTLTSDRIAATAAKRYAVKLWSKENSVKVTTQLGPLIDTHIVENLPTTNYGEVTTCVAGCDHTPLKGVRALLKFNMAGLGYLNSSSLKLEATNQQATSRTMNLYRLLKNWTELGATWNKYNGVDNWDTAGAKGAGDADSTVLGSLTLAGYGGSVGTYQSIVMDKTVLQSIIDGTYDNFGFLATSLPENSGYNIIWSSRDAATYQPILEIIHDGADYTVEVKWYDHASAGSLLRTDQVCMENEITNWNERSVELVAPVGALSMEVVITATQGGGFDMDDVSVTELAMMNRMYFGPDLTLEDDDGVRKVVAGVKELHAPSAPVASYIYAAGNIDVGDHSWKQSFYDADGETTPSAKSNVLTMVAGGAWVTSASSGIDANSGLHANRTIRVLINSAGLTNTGMSGVRVSFKASSAEILGIGAAYIGQAADAGDAYDFQAAPVQLLFGGAGSVEIAAGGTVVSDEAVFTIPAGKNIIVSFYVVNNTSKDGVLSKNSVANWMSYYKDATNDASTVNASGYSSSTYTFAVSLVESSSLTEQASIPLEIGPAGTVGRKLYRTVAGDTGNHKLLATIANNTDPSYTDNIADANLGADAPSVNLSGARPLFPRQALRMAGEAKANSALTLTIDTAQVLNTYWVQATPLNSDNLEWAVWLEAGTYTVDIYGITGTDNGILDWYLDNVSIATGQDWYAASAVKNTKKSIASVTVTGSGYHTLKAVVNGKNGSAASPYYKVKLTMVSLYQASL